MLSNQTLMDAIQPVGSASTAPGSGKFEHSQKCCCIFSNRFYPYVLYQSQKKPKSLFSRSNGTSFFFGRRKRWGDTLPVLSHRFTTVPRSPNTPGSGTTPIPTINSTLLERLQVSSLRSLYGHLSLCASARFAAKGSTNNTHQHRYL